MLPTQQQGVNDNGYTDQYKAYQAPPPQVPVQQNGDLHEISPQQPGYGPGGMFAAEMDGNTRKGMV